MEFSIIGFIFRLINFGIVFTILGYIFIKYLKPQFLDEIKKEKDIFKYLKKDLKINRIQEEEVQNQILVEGEFLKSFESKLEIWKKYIEDLELESQQYKKIIDKKIEARKDFQSKNLAQYYVAKEVFKEALSEAEENLRDYYSSEQHQEEFIDEIFEKLKYSESSSTPKSLL